MRDTVVLFMRYIISCIQGMLQVAVYQLNSRAPGFTTCTDVGKCICRVCVCVCVCACAFARACVHTSLIPAGEQVTLGSWSVPQESQHLVVRHTTLCVMCYTGLPLALCLAPTCINATL